MRKGRMRYHQNIREKSLKPMGAKDLNFLKDLKLIKEDDMLARGIPFDKPLDISLTDMLGKELYPGDIIGFPTASKLKFAVYAGVQKIRRTKHHYNHTRSPRGYIKTPYVDLVPVIYVPNEKDGKRKNIRKPDWNRETGSFNSMVKIDNPVFHLDKGGISGCFSIRDSMIDDGIIDKINKG